MNKRLLILIFSVVAIVSSKKSHAQEQTPDVVGGQNAANQYPFFVSLTEPLSFGPPYSPFCGGSLIRPQWVLTAAHCVVDFSTGQNEDSIDILVNVYSLNNPNPTMQRITSDYIIRHPDFDVTGRTLLGDLALIHIKNPATGPAINLIDPTNRQYEKPFNKVEVIGFGIFDTTNLGAQPDTLQIAEIRVIPNTIANEMDRYAGLVDTTMICAGRIDTSATGAAAGDSGGPLFDIDSAGNKIQIGIVSFGMDFHSTSQFPGVFTRVSAYRDWIEQSILNYENGVGIAKNSLKKFQLNQGENYIEAVVPSHLKEDYTVKIFDLNGKAIIETTLPKNENIIRIKTDTWSAGMYIINIYSEQSVFESQKVIK